MEDQYIQLDLNVRFQAFINGKRVGRGHDFFLIHLLPFFLIKNLKSAVCSFQGKEHAFLHSVRESALEDSRHWQCRGTRDLVSALRGLRRRRDRK